MPEFLAPVFASLAVIATLSLSVGLLRVQVAVGSGRAALLRAEVRRAEALRLQDAEARLAELQCLTERGVSGGTEVVRAVHKGIAAIPFGVLERIPATRDTTRVVRQAHDLISAAVYGSIKAVNRGVGAGVRLGLRSGAPGEPGSAEKPSGGLQDRLPFESIEQAVKQVDLPLVHRHAGPSRPDGRPGQRRVLKTPGGRCRSSPERTSCQAR